MLRLSGDDEATLRAIAGTIAQQGACVADLMVGIRLVRSHLVGLEGVIESILRRAAARAD